MEDERVGAEKVPIPCAGRAHAEVDLLSISEPERVLVELSDLVQRAPRNEHAEADGRRDLDEGCAVLPGEVAVELPGGVTPRRRGCPRQHLVDAGRGVCPEKLPRLRPL